MHVWMWVWICLIVRSYKYYLCLHTAFCTSNYTFEGTPWTVSWTVTGSNIMFDMFGPAGGWFGIGFSEAPGVDSVSSA